MVETLGILGMVMLLDGFGDGGVDYVGASALIVILFCIFFNKL